MGQPLQLQSYLILTAMPVLDLPFCKRRGFVRSPYKMVKFLITRQFYGFRIPDEPLLLPKASAWFKNALQTTTHYLEYGSGGSTVTAARHVHRVVSVENDKVFFDHVEKALATAGVADRCKLIHIDIGATVRWGDPLWPWPSKARLECWKNYPIAPWRYLRQAGIEPDLILVDGRFRVACVLTSLLNLKNQACTILLDDYAGRPEYRAVEPFADVVQTVDRMAVLRKKPDMDTDRCAAVLERHYARWR
jgi:hypothetical protein